MISYIKGRILHAADDFLIVEAGNVGYKIFVSSETLERSQSEGEEVELYCAPYIREETVALYGVLSFSRLRMFESLLAVSGVGPKAALALSSFPSVENLKEALREGRVRVKGLGPKKLQKILFELTGKPERVRPADQGDGEELPALVSLGFSRGEAKAALDGVPEGKPQERVKQALRILQH